MRFLFSAVVLALLVSCSSDDRSLVYPETLGLSYAESEKDMQGTYNSLRAEIQNSDLHIYKEINFKQLLESHRKRSRETRMIMFSNPLLEAQLIEQKPEIGMEFPSRILTYEDRNGYVLAGYNNIEYLGRMYDISDIGALQNLEASLSQIVSKSTENMVLKNNIIVVGRSHMTLPSANSFNDTYNSLRNAIADNPNLSLIETVDHAENGRLAGVELRPNRLLLFVAGEFEADLVDREQLASIDLPIRILVWVDENNKTQITYQNLDTLLLRHALRSDVYKLDDIKNLLARMVIEAAN